MPKILPEKVISFRLHNTSFLQYVRSSISALFCCFGYMSPRRYSDALHVKACNKKISHLVRSDRLEDARAMFDGMRFRDTVSWNSMISGYVKHRHITNARELFDEMPERDVVSWNLIISGYMSCCENRYIDEGRLLFDAMPVRDCVSWNTMISSYSRCGRMDDALCLFNAMKKPNVTSWNAMITGFLHNGDHTRAIECFARIPERDSATITALVAGLVRNGDVDKAAEIVFEYGLQHDKITDLVYAYNVLIAGFGEKGRTIEARRLFDQLSCKKEGGKPMRDVISWNSIIMCYVKAGDISAARKLFDEMTERDTVSWNTMISAYSHSSQMEEAMNLFYSMPAPDTLTWNSVIAGFSQLGKFEIALDLFQKMPRKDLVTWNSILSGYEKHGDYQRAIDFFIGMQNEGVKPDKHTLSSLLSLCSGFVNLNLGLQFHQWVSKTIIADVPLSNTLITMYSRCGAIKDALAIFDDIKMHKDVISWNAMIGGYASYGFGMDALRVFKEMKRNRIKPTYITFIAVLNACAHAGVVEEGRRQFNSMICEFGIQPRVEHYASLVYILGQSGRLEEAINVINNMIVEPNKYVWGALLGACRVYKNLKFARLAADALMKLEPESSAPYMLLYNMYADVEQWDDATMVRISMENNYIEKQRASSWIGSSS